MRLIDADKLQEFFLKRINNDYDGELVTEICEIIDNQPTAYDVDKVVDQISNKMFSAELYGDKWNGQTVDNLLCMGDVYEIVKAGGKDE